VAGPAKRLTPQPMLVVPGDGVNPAATLVIDDDEMFVGRRPSSHLVISDPHVSQTHARIRRSSGAILIEDLGSTNGTFVNGEPIVGPLALRHGDIVRFGAVDVRFEDRASQMIQGESTEIMERSGEEDALLERPVLSPRQSEVLAFLKQGLTNPQIAERLGVTERTVKAHCQEVYDRLGVPNRTAAVDAAHRLGLPVEEQAPTTQRLQAR
jgi:pSer/pThr/pTyr-binding forkhead associated (FHA) protein